MKSGLIARSNATAWLFVGALALGFAAPPLSVAKAGDGGAFLGGMLAGHVLTGFIDRDQRRTQAEEYQAYRPQPAPVYVAPPAPAPAPAAAPQTQAAKTPEQRIKELENLASQGLISKEEYQSRRKAILDSI